MIHTEWAVLHDDAIHGRFDSEDEAQAYVTGLGTHEPLPDRFQVASRTVVTIENPWTPIARRVMGRA